MKLLTAAILIALTTGAQAYTTHCQRNGGPTYACHICTRGSNWMTLTEYECSAKEEARQERDRIQRQCMIDLTTVPDGEFKRRCLEQSEKMP